MSASRLSYARAKAVYSNVCLFKSRPHITVRFVESHIAPHKYLSVSLLICWDLVNVFSPLQMHYRVNEVTSHAENRAQQKKTAII